MTAVTIDDAFWAPKLEINRTVTIPHILQGERRHRPRRQLREGRGQEERAVRRPPLQRHRHLQDHRGGVVFAGACRRSAAEHKLDELIQLIAESQEKDGYLFPARTIDPEHPAPGVGPERWIYENGSHELYNAGHLYEAAVAHFKATGKRTLLDVAIRNADLVCRDVRSERAPCGARP